MILVIPVLVIPVTTGFLTIDYPSLAYAGAGYPVVDDGWHVGVLIAPKGIMHHVLSHAIVIGNQSALEVKYVLC